MHKSENKYLNHSEEHRWIYGNIYMIHLRALAPVRPEWMFEPGENIYLP